MSAAAILRVGWCPGALRPMPVGDGLLVRVKPRANRLTIGQARAVAAAAARFGSGVLTITARANLQIRGADKSGLPALTDVLAAASLLDPSPEGEAARNVLASPLAGDDPEAVLDIRPLVAALEAALVHDPLFARLPAKFNWTLDDGGVSGLDTLPSDVRFRAARHGGATVLLVSLGDAAEWRVSAAPQVVATARALAEAFLDLCAERGLVPHRMRDLVMRCGAGAVFSRAGLTQSAPSPADRPSPSLIGVWARGDRQVVGAAPAFGRLEAGVLDRFARAAGVAGALDLRLTPWRGLLVPGLDPSRAAILLEAAAVAGLIVDPADPRLPIAACAGQPACRRAGAPVQADAEAFARLLPPAMGTAIALHVSGCQKGCAQAGAVPLTLVAREGRYDLVRNGRAGDPPERVGLSVAEVTAMLERNGRAQGEGLA